MRVMVFHESLPLVGRVFAQMSGDGRPLTLDSLPWHKGGARLHKREGAGRSPRLEVEVDGQCATTGPVHTGGELFERVVSDALLRAGALEVLGNIVWEYTKELQEQLQRKYNSRVHRLEMDIAARLSRGYLCVSCKTSKNVAVTRECSQIKAAAIEAFGFHALPVLVRPRVAKSVVEDSIRDRDAVVQLGLTQVLAPDRLQELLEEALAVRSQARGAG